MAFLNNPSRPSSLTRNVSVYTSGPTKPKGALSSALAKRRSVEITSNVNTRSPPSSLDSKASLSTKTKKPTETTTRAVPKIALKLEESLKKPEEPLISPERIQELKKYIRTTNTKQLIALFEKPEEDEEEEEEEYEYEYEYVYEEEKPKKSSPLKMTTTSSSTTNMIKSVLMPPKDTFLSIPKKEDFKERRSYSQFLNSVPLLSSRNPSPPHSPRSKLRPLSDYDVSKVLLVQNRLRLFLARNSLRTKLRQHKQRTHIVREILETEKTFVYHLRCLVEIYFAQFDFNTKVSTQPYLSQEQVNLLFSNARGIFQLNTQFCKELAQRVESWGYHQQIGNLFIKYAPFLKMYTVYCQNYDNAISLLNQFKLESRFSSFLLQCELHPDNNDLPLDALMITPVQRIPRYILLLKDLLKNTWKDHVDHQLITKSLVDLESIATMINQSIHHADNLQKVITLHHALQGAFQLVAPGRTFVMEGAVQLCNLNNNKMQRFRSVWLFLFNDVIVWATYRVPMRQSLNLLKERELYRDKDRDKDSNNLTASSSSFSGSWMSPRSAGMSAGSLPSAFVSGVNTLRGDKSDSKSEVEYKYLGDLNLNSNVTIKDVGSDTGVIQNAFHLSSADITITIQCASPQDKSTWCDAIVATLCAIGNRLSQTRIGQQTEISNGFFSLSGAIVGTSKLKSTVVYVIEMKEPKRKKGTYQVIHSYRDFENLRQLLEVRHPNINLLSLPAKNLISDRRKDQQSLRRVVLDSFLQSILSNPKLCSSPEVICFLTPQQEDDYKHLSKSLKATLQKAKQQAGLSLMSSP